MAEVFVSNKPSGVEVFVGRDLERELLHRALEDVNAGRPRVVVVEGVAGVGKTALVRQFLTGQADLQVLAATGDEGETALAYGVMDQFWVQAGLSQPPALPNLASGLAAIPEPVAVGAELVAALGSLQDSGSIVLLLDDAMWADTPSLQALTVALRRLHADRVLALILLRSDTITVLPEGLRRLLEGERGSYLQLEGLDGSAVRTLSLALGRGELSERAAERLRSHTAGNPLYIRALLDELAPAVLADVHGALAAPRSLSVVVLARVAARPSAGRDLVIAGSVLGMRFDVGTAARLASLAKPLLALEQTTGLLVQPGPGQVASELVVSTKTVEYHLASVYTKLGVSSRTQLAAHMAKT